ncbi:MAG: hypothetical protein PHQ40_03830 [Anaerolineaceae bacterium]|nr:hypothetical protein [Anaerolineaceae bacterium]
MGEKFIENNGSNDEIKTLAQTDGEKRDWKNIAEIRMFLYIVPVAIILIIVAVILSKVTGGG